MDSPLKTTLGRPVLSLSTLEAQGLKGTPGLGSQGFSHEDVSFSPFNALLVL